jgi:hypothetical protein
MKASLAGVYHEAAKGVVLAPEDSASNTSEFLGRKKGFWESGSRQEKRLTHVDFNDVVRLLQGVQSCRNKLVVGFKVAVGKLEKRMSTNEPKDVGG